MPGALSQDVAAANNIRAANRADDWEAFRKGRIDPSVQKLQNSSKTSAKVVHRSMGLWGYLNLFGGLLFLDGCVIETG